MFSLKNYVFNSLKSDMMSHEDFSNLDDAIFYEALSNECNKVNSKMERCYSVVKLIFILTLLTAVVCVISAVCANIILCIILATITIPFGIVATSISEGMSEFSNYLSKTLDERKELLQNRITQCNNKISELKEKLANLEQDLTNEDK